MVFGAALFSYAYISKPARMPTWAMLKSGPLRDELKEESTLLSTQFSNGSNVAVFSEKMKAQNFEESEAVSDSNGKKPNIITFKKKFKSYGCCIYLKAYYDENGKITSTDATVLSDTEPFFT